MVAHTEGSLNASWCRPAVIISNSIKGGYLRNAKLDSHTPQVFGSKHTQGFGAREAQMNFLPKLVAEWGLLDVLEQSYPTSLVVKVAYATEKDLIARDRFPQS